MFIVKAWPCVRMKLGGWMEGKGRILVVDDHKTVVRLMEAVLKIKGYGVLHAEDGLTAMEVARREKPDLIFLDIMMPGMDGFQVCRQLKLDPTTAGIPIIFLTARGEESDVATGKAAGCDGFVKKPFRTLEVLSLVEQHLRRG